MLLVIPSLLVYPSSLILPIRSILHLDKHISDADIVKSFVLPIPGQGSPDKSYTTSQLLQNIHSIIPQLKELQSNIAKSLILTHPKPLLDILRSDSIYIIGHDLGGVIAQEYAMKYPSSVAALCTVGVGLRFNTFAYAVWKKTIVDICILKSKLTRSIAKLCVWNFRHKQLISLLDEYPYQKGFNSGANIISQYNWHQSITKKPRTLQASYISIPQLLIAGKNDVFCLHSNVIRLKNAIDSLANELGMTTSVQVHSHKQGHDFYDDIVEFTTILREFLSNS